MLRVGLILFVAGIFCGIFGTIFLTKSQQGLAILETYLCKGNDTLLMMSYTSSEDEEWAVLYCQNADSGEMIDVNDQFMPIIGLLFVPLILSFPVILIGYSRRAQRAVTAE